MPIVSSEQFVAQHEDQEPSGTQRSSVSGLSWNVMYTVQARHVAGADRWAKRCTSEFGLHRAVVKISKAWIDQLSTRSYWPGSGHGGRRQTPHGKGDYG